MSGSRHASPYGVGEQLGRMAWAVCQATLFRWSPRPLYRWRVWLLRLFGARVQPSARIHPTVRIQFPWNLRLASSVAIGDSATLYALDMIELGERVTISQHAYLCAGTHDYRDPSMPLVRRPIRIDEDAWVAARAFVGPGVEVGAGAILGAGSVTMRSLAAWQIYAGNPATAVKLRPHL